MATPTAPDQQSGHIDESEAPVSIIPSGPSPFLIARKKLPWLDDGQQHRAGSSGPVREGEQGQEHTSIPHNIPTILPNSGPSRVIFGSDPSLREIGSAPSLRDHSQPRAGDFRTLSLSSNPRRGIRAPVSKRQAKLALGILSEKPKITDYSPSEYSANTFSEPDELSGISPKDETTAQKQPWNKPRRPVRSTNTWLQTQLTLPLEDASRRPVPEHISSSGSLPYDAYDHVRRRASEREEIRARRMSRRAKSMSTELIRPSYEIGDGLPQLPSHLVGSTSSHLALQTSKPSSSPELSPRITVQRPGPVARRLRRESQQLSRAVTGLENLMEEALNVAKGAAQNGRPQEVAHIFDSATMALRRASTVHSKMEYVLPALPTVSNSSSGTSTEYSESDVSTPAHSRHPSMETSSTILTHSAPSSHLFLVEQPTHETARAGSETAVFDHVDPSETESMTKTPPRLYQPPSVDSIVRDFAYPKPANERSKSLPALTLKRGAAADYYGDMGESVAAQPGVRQSIVPSTAFDKAFPSLPTTTRRHVKETLKRAKRAGNLSMSRDLDAAQMSPQEGDHIPANTAPITQANLGQGVPQDDSPRRRKGGHHHVADFFETSYFHHPHTDSRRISTVTDASGPTGHLMPTKNLSLRHPRRNHISLREGQGFSLGRYHRRQPIAREWNTARKRITATIACFNTVFIGLIAGIYAGEVPKIQYQIADISHKVILGNVLLFIGLGLTTIIFWPLPLLHGRKPYTLLAFALMLPLQFPQALAVSAFRDPSNPLYRCGLLIPRVLTGLAMGFANVNQLPTLFDLFGVSLMSARPHQEIVQYDDVRRQGGGVGLWLGIWSWCFIGSLSIGFCVGACIISALDPAWGFYIVVMLLAFFLLVNVIAPETRRAPYRRSIAHFLDDDEKLQRRVARGEVKLHISNDGPKWWFQEVWAGIILTKRMVCQPGYFILMLYISWIYCQVTAVVLLLGALLSRDYQWQPQYVGAAVLSLAMGALLSVPLDKASLFSRARVTPQRTDSMTMHTPRIAWSSHLTRRCIFTLALPFAGLAYTLSSPGDTVHWSAPIIFCGLVGFLSNLAIAECVGLIMETFDTCDLQPGANSKHRLQSMGDDTRRRRTNYSSFPRVCAGFFCAQGLGFFLAAAATGISGDVTRALGAQTTTAIVAGVLLVITILLLLVLWRYKHVQVIPSNLTAGFDTMAVKDLNKKGDDIAWGAQADDAQWKPVVIGNPSGQMRRVNLLEMGSLSRWTEIRKLNKLTGR